MALKSGNRKRTPRTICFSQRSISKQLLGLGKSQGTDFDTQIADTTIVMVQHIFLSIKNRVENYESMGRLFENTKAECLEIELHDRLLALLIAIAEIIYRLFGELDSQELISRVLNNPEVFERLKRIMAPPQERTLENVA